MNTTKSIFFLLLLSFSLSFAQEKQPFPKGGLEAIMQNVNYPEEAKKAGIEGKVFIKAVIDNEGNVVSTEILKSDNDELNKAAVNAVKATKFIPAEKDGKTVKSEVTIPIMFKLANKDKWSTKK